MSAQRFTIKKGLDLPITGEPVQEIESGPPVRRVALLGADYVGMKPTMKVQEGDTVALGQPLFEDKKTPGVVFTAPAAGKVAAVNRGEKRLFLSVVIEKDGDEAVSFDPIPDVRGASHEQVRDLLVASGQWTMLRTRPFSRVPSPESRPHALFINAMDTNPHAADPGVVLRAREDDFVLGLIALSKLTEGTTWLCFRPGTYVPGYDLPEVTVAQFDGPHPSGNVGTHIHHLSPVSANRTVWHVSYQDVIATGHLMRTGRLDDKRVVSLSGPAAKNPRLIETSLGASMSELIDGEIADGFNARRVSGSVLHGRHVEDADLRDKTEFLGRYHTQVSLLEDGGHRELLGWHMPGGDKFSARNVFTAAIPRAIRNLLTKVPEEFAVLAPPAPPEQKHAMTASANGSPRAMVPIGMYEDVMPLDVIPTFLLRALITRDTDQAQALGALELDEEDLALCNFVCPGKTEYGSLLRENLTIIERDG